MKSDNQEIRIVHCIEAWLAQTMVWLFNQISHLPNNIDSYIVSQSLLNIDQFKLGKIYSLDSLPSLKKLFLKIGRKIGLINPIKMHLALLEKVIRKYNPSIIHSHFGHYGWVNSKMAVRYGLKHVVNFYGADVNYLPNEDSRWFKRYEEMGKVVDIVLCEGPFMKNSIAQLGIPENKIKIHRLGIDLAKINFKPRAFKKGDKIRFLIAGTFREKKGIPYALMALGLYQTFNADFDVTIIGDAGFQSREKSEKGKIYQVMKEWKLNDKVRMMGYQKYDVLLKEAYDHHVFISPSVTSCDGDSEGGAPVTIIEMAASGMPIISTSHCDIPYVLSEKNRPYLVNERDSKALCECIIKLVNSDWEDMIISNRKYIEDELDVRKQSIKLYQIYQDILCET